ncbi:L,D-transpeptidase family protein [Sphingomonas sp. RB56-2]|uniref:L,D-transpeptidase family protein n=1 Tax=Sphingomonas brevis TaxID=2908206 RepID=A0ABT0S6M7_9SPHN|nr:L,D-transpeptidase family protein [Sphingomonas brevis]
MKTPVKCVGIGLAAALLTVGAGAQPSKPAKPWVAPGTPGSPIDGTIFHAQVLLGAAGFSTGVIDGKEGMSFKAAVRGFQQSRDLRPTGRLDAATRRALLEQNRPSTISVKLTPTDISGDYVYPYPKKPEGQAKLKFASYRNMLEEVAERYHTTPDTIVALNGPTALIGVGQALRLPNVIPTSTSYEGSPLKDEYRSWFVKLNVEANVPQGSYIIVDKSEGQLKVMDDRDRLVAQFPVTTGSQHDPLPLGTWKVPTFSFMPPFHYQPDLFWDVDDSKDEKMLPAGPNGLVGVAWLDLTKEHYGIHGTPEPRTIGRTESHGCIRMTNWDVLRLSRMVKPGVRAVFQA